MYASDIYARVQKKILKMKKKLDTYWFYFVALGVR